jgi:hypothetical protein
VSKQKGRRVPPPDAATIDLGQCCACRGTENVRNIVCLPVRSLTPSYGWGCVVCGLPSDGAVAVVCDACLESGAPILDVCFGYPKENVRTARTSLTEPFDHDPAAHEDER